MSTAGRDPGATQRRSHLLAAARDATQLAAAARDALAADEVLINDDPDLVADSAWLSVALDDRPDGRHLHVRQPARRRRGVGSDATAVEAVATACRLRLDALRLEGAAERYRRFVTATTALANALLTAARPTEIAGALESAIVPDLANQCAVRDGANDETDIDASDDPAFLRFADSRGRTITIEPIDPDDEVTVALLGELAHLALCAYAVADRFAVELGVRAVLERSLLPVGFVPVPGIQIAARYRPAPGMSQLAGGDFYDAIGRGTDGTTVIVGDVQGKGVEAATLTSLARHTLRAAALRGAAPAELLTELNRVLLYEQAEQEAAGDQRTVRFVTVACATLVASAQGVEVTVACGGHPPPIVIRSTGEVEMVEVPGMLLGAFEGAEYEERQVHLDRADTLVLYTDGVTEQRDPSRPLDEVALGRLIRGRRDVVDADQIAQLILDTVLLVTPVDARDDVALLVCCATGEAERLTPPLAG